MEQFTERHYPPVAKLTSYVRIVLPFTVNFAVGWMCAIDLCCRWKRCCCRCKRINITAEVLTVWESSTFGFVFVTEAVVLAEAEHIRYLTMCQRLPPVMSVRRTPSRGRIRRANGSTIYLYSYKGTIHSSTLSTSRQTYQLCPDCPLPSTSPSAGCAEDRQRSIPIIAGHRPRRWRCRRRF